MKKNAGLGRGFNDDYKKPGAIILDNPDEVWAKEIIIKVKEPLESEYKFFTKDKLFLHTFIWLQIKHYLMQK
ncbi:MAG: hypothetical protein OHM56_11310 [Spiroplasma phoeniceum]|nr:MAG: hypothetical protein OHM57_10730 [Spiroplasma phoeniceum]UZQ32138.1 MAG: hypothetical protein OHM56_11310 [Spiroplasma phoeniceum]